ncbi:methyltransferase domain-containing protein [Streptomyces sp. NRRL F-2664]|uniref:methyltransferase domain-containing protein n=1 Tax=Streptomyces sp. NRRL F-2664 TaxID=1463842 RepID=UPI0004CBC391|nr:methyltransferase domain-containing protein [Streptomyces sp. NRRL F-2664]
MTVDSAEARALRIQLADILQEKGDLTDPEWRRAFETVPRHAFVPAFWDSPEELVSLDNCGHLARIYSDDVLITQITDGVATSSSTAPSLMLVMLEALDVRPHHRVLEVATATGYNAALLCERVGSHHVTTIEVDPELSHTAERRLFEAGYTPTVIAADGRAGYWEKAPYDRLIATCGFSAVPYTWVKQMRPGGVIVCPVGSGTVRLVVSEAGEAAGNFLSTASYFMTARDSGTAGSAPYPGDPENPDHRPTALGPAAPFTKDGFPFLLSLTIPGVALSSEPDDTGQVTGCRLWAADGSWARISDGTAYQAGPRRLWDLAEGAHDTYQKNGQPNRERFGLTVSVGGNTVWLDDPGNIIRSLPPA